MKLLTDRTLAAYLHRIVDPVSAEDKAAAEHELAVYLQGLGRRQRASGWTEDARAKQFKE